MTELWVERVHRCWGCDREWPTFHHEPDTACPFCGSTLTTFMCRPAIDEAEDKAA